MEAATRAEAGIDFVEEFATAAEWFADHLPKAAPRAPVPACPGWSVLDLTAHLGNVHSWAATVLETGRATGEHDDEPDSSRPRRLAHWYLGKAEDLYSVLLDVPAERRVWNFVDGEGRAEFWQRRQTHETVLHGVDLAQVCDLDARLPVELATDGIDEALRVLLRRMHQRGHPADLVRPVGLHALDTDVWWVVEPVPRHAIPAQPSPADGRPTGRQAGAPPLVSGGRRDGIDVVAAPSTVLFQLLWKRVRPTHPEVRISGDATLVQRFLGSRLTP